MSRPRQKWPIRRLFRVKIQGRRRVRVDGRVCFFFLVRRGSVAKVIRMRTVIYPGSFDPLTNGHLDLIQRATKLFDRVVVAVAKSESKSPLFTLEERVEMVAGAIGHLPTVEADSFDGLLVNYVESRSAQAVVRGLRA